MLKFIILMISLLLVGCMEQPQRRTLSEASELAQSFTGFENLHFVVEANCDYQYFFDYAPMRNGGYYAYGTNDGAALLLLIPKYANDETKVIHWPLSYSIHTAFNLLNSSLGEQAIPSENMYTNVRIELTSNVLKSYSSSDYDKAFFLVFTHQGVNYIAFERNNHLVIYHEDEGFLASSADS